MLENLHFYLIIFLHFYISTNKWIRYYNNSGSFKEEDNRTEEEKRLIELEKRNRQLEMEVDILKQAALIMGRKSM